MPRAVAVVGLVVSASCGRDSPIEPPPRFPAPDAEIPVATQSSPVEAKPVTIREILGDPTLRELIRAMDEPALVVPLIGAVDALASGRMANALEMLERAQAAADALADDPDAAESLLYWSAVSRWFEEASFHVTDRDNEGRSTQIGGGSL